jgi:hypothetical protein
MNATTLLQQQAEIEDKLTNLEATLHKARTGAMGLTLEEDKTTEWRKAKAQHAVYFKMLRTINGQLNKLRKHVGYDNVNGRRVAVYQYK